MGDCITIWVAVKLCDSFCKEWIALTWPLNSDPSLLIFTHLISWAFKNLSVGGHHSAERFSPGLGHRFLDFDFAEFFGAGWSILQNPFGHCTDAVR